MPDLASSDGNAAGPDLAFSCGANTFLMCSMNNAVYCNLAGNGTTNFDCGATCVGTMGCGLCTPGAITCASNMLATCTVQGSPGTPAACVTLGAASGTCANATSCTQCAGTNVCGDGASYGTSTGSSYACAAGMVGAATPCAFGCDPMNGKCRDSVPANQAAANLAATDSWTCTGTQSATLGALTTTSGNTVDFDTTVGVVTVNGTANTAVNWGAPYTPTGSGTSARVVHVKSVNFAAGTTVTLRGASALILLVDGNVAIAGASGMGMATTFNLAAALATSGGPGAPSSNGAAGAGQSMTDSGGGGAGHGTAGATGGIGNASATGGGTPGSAYGTAEILEAGAAGGNGDGLSSGAGGKGGGGLQISACGTISITGNVILNASGGGGKGGAGAMNMVTSGAGGGGGGSGGTLLLEGKAMPTLAGTLVANGGGAGAGGAGPGNNGTDGANPDPTMPGMAATGGTNNFAGAGGSGGAYMGGNVPPKTGANGSARLGGGGGGGAFGRIFLNVAPGQSAPVASSVSPAPKTSTMCVTVKGAPPVTCTYP